MSDKKMSREVTELHFDQLSSGYSPAWMVGKIGVPKEWGEAEHRDFMILFKREVESLCIMFQRRFEKKQKDLL